MTLQIDSAAAMEILGQHFAQMCQAPMVIYLQGDLGSGKTTLARGFLRGLGHFGKVKSPTYTLVESYHLADYIVYHFDLYRLSDPEELDYLGVRDYLEDKVICLIEWAARGQGYIPLPDVEIEIHYQATGRLINFVAHSTQGEHCVTALYNILNS
jgi:tRNA threonylcarbamoyladenosine biosynthesis protein TsaE